MSSTGFSTSSTGWEPPSPEELQRILPQYEITAILGRGGMGAVYKGRQTKLNRNVAIKVLPEVFSKGRDELNFAKRFEQEAQAMAGLDHPAILSVYDFGETPDGLLYFVMEFVDGMDISQYLKHHGGKLPQEHALSITAHVLDALEYAHRQGIVHRDIKPANILLNTEGRVKIADFGLAKRFGDAGDPSLPALTMSNVAVGTPDFVAPEALDGERVPDHRADLYAVGVMLYQMLTGKLPRGNYRLPSDLSPGIDPRLDAIVGKAMQSDPDLRYGNAAEVRADLDEVMTQPLAKVEAGAESQAVEAVVPVDTTVKRGAPVRTVEPKRREKVVAKKPEKSNGLLLAAIGTGVAVLAIIGVVAVVKKRGTGILPGPPSAGETPGERASSFADKSTVFPVEGTAEGGPGKMPMLQESSELAKATKEAPFENTLGMKFVPVPGTEVLFCIHEVRYKDYAAYAAEVGGVDGAWIDQSADGYTPTERTEDHPVMRVSWDDAKMFCAWLSKKEGNQYRLPTDHEWSEAVGIGQLEIWKTDTTPATVNRISETYPWGSEWPPPKGAGNFSDESANAYVPSERRACLFGYDDFFPRTAPVMSFKPNEVGLYDLSGNLWEWVEDWFDSEKKDRVLRGASWGDGSRGGLWSSARVNRPSDQRNNRHGFRCVLEKVPQPRSPGNLRTVTEPPTEPWVDGLAAWWGGVKSHESFVRSSDGMTRQMSDHATLFALPESAEPIRDQAARATVRLESGADSFSLAVRRKAFPAGKFDNYHAHLSKSGNVVRLARFIKSEHLGLIDFPLPTGFDFSASHTLELRVVGDIITVSLDGRKLGSRRDTELLAGFPTLSASKGAVIEHFEYLNLDPPVPPAAAATIQSTKDQPFTNTLGMKFVPMPGTEVLFCIHDVRYKDYAAYAAANPEIDMKWREQILGGFLTSERPGDHPVVRVSWEDAQSFCQWLSRKEGKTYRLPTDQEWSFAAGVPGDSISGSVNATPNGPVPREVFPWGVEWPPPRAAGNYSDESRKNKAPHADAAYLDGYDDGFPTTAPVMSFEPNLLGFYDLGGNILEWCEDWNSDSKSARVLRGGSWVHSERSDLLLSRRFHSVPSFRGDAGGFRLVVESEGLK